MKRLIIILIFLFSGIISAQNFSTKDVTNSTDTALDSAGVFSPNEWRLVTNYNSITVTIKSDQSSASSGVKIKFATKKTNGIYVVVDSINTTYTAGTIFNNAYPITAPYLKVFYTNTTTAQSYFSMVTMLNVSFGATAISIAGGATAANQATQITRADSLALLTKLLYYRLYYQATAVRQDSLDNMLKNIYYRLVDRSTGAKQDTSIARLTAIRDTLKNKLNLAITGLRDAILGASNKTLTDINTSVGTNTDTLTAQHTTLTAIRNFLATDSLTTKDMINLKNLLTQLTAKDFATETTLALIKTAVELIDNAVDGNYLNVNTNFAGVDASTNIGTANATTQRVVIASDQPTLPITLTPTDTITVKKIIDALPTGTNILGSVGIDQTTPGTTNKVSIGTDGTVTANAGTNLNTSALSLEATQVDVKANQTNGTQKTQVVDGSGNVIGSTTNALDINIKSGNITGFATQTTLDSLKKALAPATKFVGLTDTVTTRVDTVAFTGTWAEGEIKADDSCEVAINGSFTTGQTFIITETTAVKIPKWAIATSNKLFIRRYGNIGTVRFYLRLSSY